MTRDHARKRAIRARMAATGEPYSVAARAIDGEPISTEAAAAAPEPTAAGDRASESATAESATAESATAESATAESAIAESAAAESVAADPADALAGVIGSANRTLAASSARIEIRADTDLGRDPVPARRRPLRSRPGLLGRLTRRAAGATLGRVAPGFDPAALRELALHQFGVGFAGPADRRYLIDFGGFAQARVDGRYYSGQSGELLGPRYENQPGPSRRGDPLHALGRLRRATAARPAGTEQVRRTPCQVVTATVGPDEFTVWIDGQHIRRFQTVERGSGRYTNATRTETVELWDFGVPVDDLDWSRLPIFRTPG